MKALLALALVIAPVPVMAETVIRASRVWDPIDGVFADRDIHVVDGKITAITTQNGEADIDLTGLTVLPGLVDTHSHISAHFDNDGRIVPPDGDGNETAAEAALRAQGNAWATVRSGVTTVQSPGEMLDRPLRDLIASGVLPGPRILTSIGRIEEDTGPDEIRAKIRRLHAEGSDFVKLFATTSGRDEPRQRLSDESIIAGCEEAAALGQRAIVHAHLSHAAIVASNAGCSVIEHGGMLDAEAFAVLASNGTYYDPNFLVSQIYIENKSNYLGTGNYTEESFRQMERAGDHTANLVELALAAGVKVVTGSDAVAGGHGQNPREIVYRVELAGQSPHDALVGATILSAQSLGLGEVTGRVAIGYAADLIATAGDPLTNIRSILEPVFVMANGVRVR